jgi:ribose/xylose/arabinose/galactoside ABC-type transport system permease subunit
MLLNFRRWREHQSTIIVYLVLIGLVIGSSIFSDVFRSPRNMKNLAVQSVALGLVSIGQTFTILTAGIDLSVGSVISMVTLLTAGLPAGNPQMLFPVIILVIGLSLFVGFLNGLVISRTGVHPLIVTLGMMSIVQGAILLYSKVPVGPVPETFSFFAWGEIGKIPFPFLLFAAVAAISIIILNKTTFGRYIYATGGDEQVARLSGISTFQVKVFAYMYCSFTAALSGLFLISRLGMSGPLGGERFMLDSIIPVLIGGTALTGGKGGVTGTIAGVFIMTILGNIFNLLGVHSYWQWVISGMIIITAVAFFWKEKET